MAKRAWWQRKAYRKLKLVSKQGGGAQRLNYRSSCIEVAVPEFL